MERALELAWRGWGRVAPNPLVGAVLLRDGAPVGEGFHAEFGGPHAEVAALEAGNDARGATCVVTLEPCTHHGKTPPCDTALLEAGVRRIVAAVRDPHPEAGGALERLREAGVEVEVGLLQEQAAALNAVFLWNMALPKRPFVALKLATSLDGFIADADGRSKWISQAEAGEFVHWLRAGFDAIGIGRRTAAVDDPELTARGALRPRVAPTRVVFSRSGNLPPTLRVLTSPDEAPTTVVVEPGRASVVEAALARTGAEVLAADGLEAALEALRAAGVGSILIEGGGELAGGLLEAGLVDRVYWIQAPIWLGSGTPAFGTGKAVALEAAESWTVTDRRALGRDTLLVVDRRLCLQGL
jgi:diaminohydroxyphosphoribosylaminopyrimidine deaminase/5-amino-6-(5-phosphoribosylamino)uracil reductase